MKHKKIAITGGPNSGKTTALSVLKETFGPQVELVREAATMIFSGGTIAARILKPPSRLFS